MVCFVCACSELLESQDVMLWIDNYNKLLKYQTPAIGKNSTLVPMNWTVVGAMVFERQDADDQNPDPGNTLSLLRPEGRDPPQMFVRSDFIDLKIREVIDPLILAGIQKPPTNISQFTRRVPLSLANPGRRDHGTRFFQPVKLLDVNISSNSVFLAIMNEVRLKFEHRQRFVFLLMDVNLYKRCMKVRICAERILRIEFHEVMHSRNYSCNPHQRAHAHALPTRASLSSCTPTRTLASYAAWICMRLPAWKLI